MTAPFFPAFHNGLARVVTCLLALCALTSLSCFCLRLFLLERCWCKSVGERCVNLRALIAGHRLRQLRCRRHLKNSVLDHQLHRPLYRYPHSGVPCIDPCVVIEQQILARMQIGHILVTVVCLNPRCGKLLNELSNLVLHVRAIGQVAELTNIYRLRPLVIWTIFVVQMRIDDLADAIAKDCL